MDVVRTMINNLFEESFLCKNLIIIFQKKKKEKRVPYLVILQIIMH